MPFIIDVHAIYFKLQAIYFEIQATFLLKTEVQAIYCWSTCHLSSKYKPFFVEVKAIYS